MNSAGSSGVIKPISSISCRLISGRTVWALRPGIGFVIRWDYYKELGYPKVSNEDDLLNVLADMIKKHPKTEDGKNVYAMGACNDWGLWSYFLPMAAVYGYNNWAPSGYVLKVDTNVMSNNYLEPDSPLWKTVAFYYKARKMGIL